MKFNKEDSLMFALKMNGGNSDVDKVLKDAAAIRNWMSDDTGARPEWAEVSKFTDVVAERDRARDLAVRLEQENAELTRTNAELEGTLNQVGLVSAQTQRALLEATQELEEAREHLARGVLSTALRIAQSDPERSGIRVVQLAAEKFGVSL